MSVERLRLRQAFVEAVNDLAADPSGANVVRYLLASRNLGRPGNGSQRPRPRTAKRAGVGRAPVTT